jgi:hypothetical protein
MRSTSTVEIDGPIALVTARAASAAASVPASPPRACHWALVDIDGAAAELLLAELGAKGVAIAAATPELPHSTARVLVRPISADLEAA